MMHQLSGLYSYSYSGNHSRLTTYYNSSRHVVLTGEITEQMAWLKFLFFPEHHNFLFYFGRHFMLLGKYQTADRIAGTFRTRRIRHALPETIYRYIRTLFGKRVGKEKERWGKKKKKRRIELDSRLTRHSNERGTWDMSAILFRQPSSREGGTRGSESGCWRRIGGIGWEETRGDKGQEGGFVMWVGGRAGG